MHWTSTCQRYWRFFINKKNDRKEKINNENQLEKHSHNLLQQNGVISYMNEYQINLCCSIYFAYHGALYKKQFFQKLHAWSYSTTPMTNNHLLHQSNSCFLAWLYTVSGYNKSSSSAKTSKNKQLGTAESLYNWRNFSFFSLTESNTVTENLNPYWEWERPQYLFQRL